jgi:hypothetical protein
MANYRTPTNIRFPPDLHPKIKAIAEERDISFAQVVIEACYQYIDGKIPGLCPSCHHQNDPDSKFCGQCSASLGSDFKHLPIQAEAISNLSMDIQAFENLESIDEYITKVQNEIGAVNIHLEALVRLRQDIANKMKKQ